MTWPKNWRISSNISGFAGPIFASFTTYQSVLHADDGSVGYIPICPGTLSWQPNKIAKMYQRRCIWCTSARKRIAISWSSCAH